MPPNSIVGWIAFVLGAVAIAALWFIPIHKLRSGLAGALCIFVAMFCAYFGLDTWLTVGFSIVGVVCLVVFWFSDSTRGETGGI